MSSDEDNNGLTEDQIKSCKKQDEHNKDLYAFLKECEIFLEPFVEVIENEKYSKKEKLSKIILTHKIINPEAKYPDINNFEITENNFISYVEKAFKECSDILIKKKFIERFTKYEEEEDEIGSTEEMYNEGLNNIFIPLIKEKIQFHIFN